VASALTGHQDDFADGQPVPAVHLLAACSLLGLVAGGAVLGWRGHRRDPALAFQAVLCTLGGIGTAIAVLSVRSIDGPILRHLLSFATGLGVLVWVAAAVAVATALRTLTRPPWIGWVAIGLATVVAGGLLLEVVSVGPWNRNPDYPSQPEEVRHRLLVDNEQAATTAELALRSPLLRRGSRVQVVWPAGWEIGAGVVNELQKEGYDVTVSSDVGFIFGESLESDGTESVRVVVVPERREYPPEWPAPPPARFHVGNGLGYQVFLVPLR
jgi:hypothetical protein